MSSTRHATSNGPLRQERFCSSREFERGLMANLVAKRCDLLSAPADRALLWFIQFVSWTEAGLKGLAKDLVSKYPERFVTQEMQEFGCRPGQNYNARQIERIRPGMPFSVACELPLKGELDGYTIPNDLELLAEAVIRKNCKSYDDTDRYEEALKKERAAMFPSHYAAQDLAKICRGYASEDGHDDSLATWLTKLCLDPESSLSVGPWYCPTLIEMLRDYREQWIKQKRERVVVTQLGSQVYETLDYGLQGRCMVLIDGLARTGKTFAGRAWCDEHVGEAVYVQVPSSTDEIGFFRAIARSLGVSINLNSKAHHLRDRIEDVLQRGHLMVVFDEAHYLWPQSNYRHALPGRVNWIMTSLVNNGVPVALITTPQFIRTQKAIEEKSSWTAEQFIGRIGHYEKLPDSLSKSDLEAVAESLLPEADERAIELLVTYAQASAKYLAGIESAVRRARFLAAKEERQKVLTADVKRAIKEGAIPSDSALAQAVQACAKPTRRGSIRALAKPIPEACKPRENDLPADAGLPETAGSRSAGLAPLPSSTRNRVGEELIKT